MGYDAPPSEVEARALHAHAAVRGPGHRQNLARVKLQTTPTRPLKHHWGSGAHWEHEAGPRKPPHSPPRLAPRVFSGVFLSSDKAVGTVHK